MARNDVRTMRNETDGVTWKVKAGYLRLAIEIVFDDEPDAVIRRERKFTEAQWPGALGAIIAEQVASGFVLEPLWTPTAQWIRDADVQELNDEIQFAWLMLLGNDPTSFTWMPPSVRSYLAIDLLIGQCRRNGLSSFVLEGDPQVVGHLVQAAGEVGLPELGPLFEKAMAGSDPTLIGAGVTHRMRWGDGRAAKKLERLAVGAFDWDDRLIAWMREHAEDFVAFATRPAPATG